MADDRYRDESWLRKQLETEKRSKRSVARMCDVADSTIRDWADRYGIEGPDFNRTPSELKDSEWLHGEYVNKQRSTTDIADELDCSNVTVGEWLRKHDIGTRSQSEAAVAWQLDKIPQYEITDNGYEYWKTNHDGEQFSVPVHRLVAVSMFGFDAISGKVVHHENGIPWDNRPENLSLKTKENHTRYHSIEYHGDGQWRDRNKLQTALQDATPGELAERWGCHKQTVQRWIRRHNIEYTYDSNQDAPWRNEETLRDAYRDATRDELAQLWDCSRTTVDNWLARFDISADDVKNK